MSVNPASWTEQLTKIFVAAKDLAVEHQNSALEPQHLAAAAFKDGLARTVATRLGVDGAAVATALDTLVSRLPSQSPPPPDASPSTAALRVLSAASKTAKKAGETHTAVDHLLRALVTEKSSAAVAKELVSHGLSETALSGALEEIKGGARADSRDAEGGYDALHKYGIDLVEQARKGKLDPVIGRDMEVRRVIQILSRRTKNNPVLVGEPGVGKTAIAEALAQRILAGDVPEGLRDRSVVSLDMGALVAGASYRGQFEERLKSVLEEVARSEGKIVLFVDEVHLVLGAGKTDGAMDAANMLKPALARGELRMLGATTAAEYRQYMEKDAAFERRFQRVNVEPPSVPETISILRGLKERYETHHGVRIADAALVSAATLADRYITTRFLPDKAIDLVDEACAAARVQLDSRPEAIDKLERRRMQLQMECAALGKEKDKASKKRKSEAEKELANIEEELKPLLLRYQNERGRVDELRALQEKLDRLQAKQTAAERSGDVQQAADLKYYAIPDVERRLAQLASEAEAAKVAAAAATTTTTTTTADDIAASAEVEGGGSAPMLSEEVGTAEVTEIVARWTGIPVSKLCSSERQRLLELGTRLHKRVIGQNAAVKSVTESVIRSRAGMARPGQPTGSFLFLGPTGVGKTELAKALAFELFDSESLLTRIDMSEYGERHSVARLIGAPPGYVGFDEGGQLTEAIRRRPYSVILLDEVEKAHPEVLNVLLQVLDDGRLTDSKGRTVDFSNSVIILTSNLGADLLLTSATASQSQSQSQSPPSQEQVIPEETRAGVMAAVRAHFKPEFLNRLDEIVLFCPLSRVHLHGVCDLLLTGLVERLSEREISLECSEAAYSVILDTTASDAAYGARPLRRYIEHNIVTELSRLIVAGSLPNNSTLKIDGDRKRKALSYAVSPTADKRSRGTGTVPKKMSTQT